MTPERKRDVDLVIAAFNRVEREGTQAGRAVNTIHAMADLLAEVRREERERCAKIVESYIPTYGHESLRMAAREIRAASPGQSTPDE